eukprot:gene41620-55187_t
MGWPLADPHMHQLSSLDASFLHLETPQMPMHVGALHVLELPAGFRGRFATVLRRHMAERLPLMPALRRRLWWMPLNLANPAWVDAEPDLSKHIVEHKLPASARKGDGLAEMEALVGALHPQLLDRRLPLWKFHVIEGLGPSAAGLRRVALYTQAHHAAVDGQAAVALANIELMERENLVGKVRDDIGPYLAERFEELNHHPLVGMAETCGFVAGLVLVKNKATKQMFDEGLGVGMKCRAHCFKNGLIMRAVGDRMIIAPPLVMTRAQIDEMMALIHRCLDATMDELRAAGQLA